MKSLINTAVLVLFLCLLKNASSQELLSPEAAISIGLANNFDIRLVRQDAAIASNNFSPGNAGFLPELNLTATQNYSLTDSKQEFLSGQVNDRKGAAADALNAGLQLNWTIFDGMRMFVNYNRLRELEQKSELMVLLTVESSVQQILSTYYSLISLNQKIVVVEKSIAIDNERLKLQTDMLDIGSGSRLEMLQARVDLNADSAILLNLQNQLSQAQTTLNQLLARPADTRFLVQDTFALRNDLLPDQLTQKMLAQNTSLLLSRRDEHLAALVLREIKGRQAPSLGLNVGYNFVNQHSESGFLAANRSLGLTYGIQANMNLFDGFNNLRERRNAAIMIESGRIRTESLENELTGELQKNYDSYQNKLRLLAMETQNVRSSAENLSISGERFRLGDLSGIEFREAQLNHMTAQGRLLQVLYEAKLLEINLLQLSGELVLN
ncbi:MAG: TolC family protein [Bacteroidales bacterium]|nr:TolC family protein [Bacteroidales bacterium]